MNKSKGMAFTFSWLGFAFFAVLALCTACEDSYTPRQIAYNRIDLPSQTYSLWDSASYPFSFEVSTAATLSPDRSKNAEPYWVNIHYPAFDADVQITYKPIEPKGPRLTEYVEEVRLLTNKHNIKAQSIIETACRTADSNLAYIFQLSGQVPTQFQFYTTDSNHHFFRGALYFKMADKNDSLQPVIDFIAADMQHLLKTLRWKKR